MTVDIHPSDNHTKRLNQYLSLTLHFYLASVEKGELKLFPLNAVSIHMHRICSHALLHCTCTHAHTRTDTTFMRSVRDYLSFHTQLKIRSVQTTHWMPNSVENPSSYVQRLLQLVNRWVNLLNQLCGKGTGIPTQLGPPLTPSPHLFNTALLLGVRGAADGHGLRMTCISRNQTPLPLALMLMTMLRDSRGTECHSACICMGTSHESEVAESWTLWA